MAKRQSARAILYYPFTNLECANSRIYHSVLLVRESITGKYALPGGQTNGKSPRKTVQRELEEELGLGVALADFVAAFKYDSLRVHHTVYTARKVQALKGNTVYANYETLSNPAKDPELLHLGFFNTASPRQIDPSILESHVIGSGGLLSHVQENSPAYDTTGLHICPKDIATFFKHKASNWDRNWRPTN
jgi:ADP-ribose pyrophosphatase YjhB (NUDIX family)